MPFLEMAGHCEALQMGNKEKMSHFMSGQLRQESFMFLPQDGAKKSAPYTRQVFPLTLSETS